MADYLKWAVLLVVLASSAHAHPLAHGQFEDDKPMQRRGNDAFANWDENGDDFLSKNEVAKAGVKWSDIAVYDLNSDQKISRKEWGILVAVTKNVRETHYLNHFRAADRNHDGFITAEELQQRYSSLGHYFELSTFQRYIKTNDRNGDKKLGYYEFKAFLQD